LEEEFPADSFGGEFFPSSLGHEERSTPATAEHSEQASLSRSLFVVTFYSVTSIWRYRHDINHRNFVSRLITGGYALLLQPDVVSRQSMFRKGKPTARWGRKVMDPTSSGTARLPKDPSFGSFLLTAIFGERSWKGANLMS
jgi:hypothetical protein